MGQPTLVSVAFAGNLIHLRCQWGGPAAKFGLELLERLDRADKEKPRRHFLTGSYFVRSLLSEGVSSGGLPQFEIDSMPKRDTAEMNFRGDWDYAYIFKAFVTGEEEAGQETSEWRVGYLDMCEGQRIEVLNGLARWYTVAEFKAFVESEIAVAQAKT